MQIAFSCAPQTKSATMNQRLPGLDALRGIAAIFVVLLHAGIPYMTNPLSFLVWPARDEQPSSFVDGLTWCTECFLMPLFFMLAGFFSIGLLISRGEKKFIEGRTRRLMVVQVAAGTFILPACLLIWSLGWVADGIYVPRDIWNNGIPIELESELYGFGHFWFLHYLYIYCLMLSAGYWVTKRVTANNSSLSQIGQRLVDGIDVVLTSGWKPLIPVIPCALILYLDPRIVLGFYQTFIPVGTKLAYYSIYFLAGAALWRHRDQLHVHSRFGKTYLAVAALLFPLLLPMIHQHLEQPLSGPRLALLAGLLASFASLTSYGLFALFLKANHADNPVMKFLAEASFWVYIIHLPFVGLAQIAIAQSSIPTIGKFLIVGAIATTLSLLTFQVFVRNHWLGAFLEGQWKAISGHTSSSRPSVSESVKGKLPGDSPALVLNSQVHPVTTPLYHRAPFSSSVR